MATAKKAVEPEAGLPAPDPKIVEKNEKAEADAQKLVAEARAGAEAEAAATESARIQALAKEQQDRRDAVTDDDGVFEGSVYSSENFIVSTSIPAHGREVVEIKPVGWVGEGFIVGSARVKELIKLLGQVKHLPKE
jgi:hypothetical protein